MRHIYLIRHGHPDFPIASRICLGQTDTPLGPLGHLQGVLLARVFRTLPLSAVYTSPLSRARETAHYLDAAPLVHEGLKERHTGDWDGLDFNEIAERFPEAYAARGKDPTLTMPGGEDLAPACARFDAAMTEILAQEPGDLAIVTHSGVLTAWLKQRFPTSAIPKLSYGGYWHLKEAHGALTLAHPLPEKPAPLMDRSLALALLAAVAPQRVIRHCLAVETLALSLCEALPLPLDAAHISHAALLHDLARTEKHHAHTGALWLDTLGYETLAAIVRHHHDIQDPHLVDEASIVYIADKAVAEDNVVPIATRFLASKKKCCTPEARVAWEKRYHDTRILQDTINTLCGKEILL